MLDLMPWILVVQLWTDPPPTMKFVYKKEYPTYEECITARQEWDQKKLVAICSPKPIDDKEKPK